MHTAATMQAELLEPVIVAGSEKLASACRRRGVRLVHVSTDMVFDGLRPPYSEDAALTPVHPYGEAKARAEQAVLQAHPEAAIVRSSLLYRLSPPDPRTARDLQQLASEEPPTLFVDEVRCPAAVEDFADALVCAARAVLVDDAPATRAAARVYHLVGPEAVTRRAFGERLLRALGGDVERLRFGTIAESGLVRPVDLTLVAEHTPAAWSSRIRSFSSVLESFESRATHS